MAPRIPKEPIFRLVSQLDAELLKRAWECVNQSKAALALPIPSTFLGGNCPPPSRQDQSPQEPQE